ncbi:hypothetical protein [Pseudoxanthomonas sp. UTMC 1351]|uniref:hypothetical protein n=1 Tax=Pseudoxanthomonas sp. UTMC 1351 TaxID=2695853 RepID=UPI0034CEF88A
MNFWLSAKATVAVPREASNAACRRNSGLPEGLSASAAAAALPGLPWTPPKDGAGRLAATALAGNASHPKVHNTL